MTRACTIWSVPGFDFICEWNILVLCPTTSFPSATVFLMFFVENQQFSLDVAPARSTRLILS